MMLRWHEPQLSRLGLVVRRLSRSIVGHIEGDRHARVVFLDRIHGHTIDVLSVLEPAVLPLYHQYAASPVARPSVPSMVDQ